MTKNMFARNSVGHPAPPLCLSLPEAEVWFGVSLSLAGSSPLPEKDRIWFGLLLAVPRRATSRPKQSSHFFWAAERLRDSKDINLVVVPL